LPQDPVYEDARRTFNALVDGHPRLVVQGLDTADIRAALQFARAHGLPVSVRGGGHSVVGQARSLSTCAVSPTCVSTRSGSAFVQAAVRPGAMSIPHASCTVSRYRAGRSMRRASAA